MQKQRQIRSRKHIARNIKVEERRWSVKPKEQSEYHTVCYYSAMLMSISSLIFFFYSKGPHPFMRPALKEPLK